MSEVTKKWIICSFDEKTIDEISKKYGIKKLLALVLISRQELLSSNKNGLHDPFIMRDMDKAVNRVRQAINNRESIVIYGDYDADGIMATTIMYKYLKLQGAIVSCYIPNRCEEGYGLNFSAIDKIRQSNANLIITVDTGIVAFEQIKYAQSFGIDVVVTDHHECAEQVPDCVAVVNPKRKDCPYPFKDLAGSGVAFKFIEALSNRYNLQELIREFTPMVAVGTVADVMPLVDENRTLVKLGNLNFKNTSVYGLRVLIEYTGLNENKIDSNSIGHVIAPRINACGRLGNQYDSLNLMLSESYLEAVSMVDMVIAQNELRREIEKKISEEVICNIEINNYHLNKIIVIASDKWHQGVVGIVASKICERYYRPCVLISISDKECKGSARSINEFNIFEAIYSCRRCLKTFGGHSLAAGITISQDNIVEFRNTINEYAESRISEDDLVSKIYIDAEIDFDDVNIFSVTELKKLEPYGSKNKYPIFAIMNLRILSITFMNNGDHAKFLLSRDNSNNSIVALAFQTGNEMSVRFKPGDIVDVAGSLEINNFRNMNNLQIIIKDIQLHNDSNLVYREWINTPH